LSGHSINLLVAHLTEQRFGKPMNMHMFREAAPTTLAIKAPEHVRIGATINNNADFRTTERAYMRTIRGCNARTTLNGRRSSITSLLNACGTKKPPAVMSPAPNALRKPV
jgi:hypothetical protein